MRTTLDTDADWQAAVPYARFSLLTEYFRTRPCVDGEEWLAVNLACGDLFGRTANEELQRDIEIEESFVDSLEKSGTSATTAFMRDRLSLRKTLAAAFCANPGYLANPIATCLEVLPKVAPPLLAIFPGGAHSQDSTLEPIHEYHLPGYTEAVGYSFFVSGTLTSADQLQFKDLQSWKSFHRHVSPIAKVLFNGFRHGDAIGPELLTAYNTLTTAFGPMVLHDSFVTPSTITSIASLARFAKASLYCDTCSRKLGTEPVVSYSPWYFRQSDVHMALGVYLYGGGTRGRETLNRDWSSWLICDNCRENGLPSILRQIAMSFSASAADDSRTA